MGNKEISGGVVHELPTFKEENVGRVVGLVARTFKLSVYA